MTHLILLNFYSDSKQSAVFEDTNTAEDNEQHTPAGLQNNSEIKSNDNSALTSL